MIVTRFAPSPTGLLHLGHAFAAITAAENGDDFLLRIEDLDRGRSRDGYIEAIYRDLKWLGLSWDEPVLRQSRRAPAYAAALAGPLTFLEHGKTLPVDPARFGDIVLARKDFKGEGWPAAYHLAVVVDDAFQGVTLVTRGEDLLPATHPQRLLQALLGLPEPAYAHHPLVLDENGKKFSKRDSSVTLASLRESGATPSDIRARLGL